jgi:hypothetical protein
MKSRAFLVRVLAALLVIFSARHALAESKQECATAADTGQSARDQGRYHAARTAFVSCMREVCPRIISQACAGWLRDLDAAMPTVVLGARDENGADLADVHVKLDGAPWADRLDGKPLAIDPGAHTVRFERDGQEPVEETVVARSGEKNRLIVVVLRRLGGAVRVEPPAADAAHSPSDGSQSSARIASGAVLFALALGSGATGTIFLLRSNHDSASAAALRTGLPSDFCTNNPSSATCGALGNDVNGQHHDALAAGLLFGGAGALAVAGTTLWVLWPHHEAASAWIAPSYVTGGAALNVIGTF